MAFKIRDGGWLSRSQAKSSDLAATSSSSASSLSTSTQTSATSSSSASSLNPSTQTSADSSSSTSSLSPSAQTSATSSSSASAIKALFSRNRTGPHLERPAAQDGVKSPPASPQTPSATSASSISPSQQTPTTPPARPTPNPSRDSAGGPSPRSSLIPTADDPTPRSSTQGNPSPRSSLIPTAGNPSPRSSQTPGGGSQINTLKTTTADSTPTFTILHPGAVGYLQEISQLVDTAVVLIFSKLSTADKSLPIEEYLRSLGTHQESPKQEMDEASQNWNSVSPRPSELAGLGRRERPSSAFDPQIDSHAAPLTHSRSSTIIGQNRGVTDLSQRSASPLGEDMTRGVADPHPLSTTENSDRVRFPARPSSTISTSIAILGPLSPVQPRSFSPRIRRPSALGSIAPLPSSSLPPPPSWLSEFLDLEFESGKLDEKKKNSYEKIFLVLAGKRNKDTLDEAEIQILNEISDFFQIYYNIYETKKQTPEKVFSQRVEKWFEERVSSIKEDNYLGPDKQNNDGHNLLTNRETILLILEILIGNRINSQKVEDFSKKGLSPLRTSLNSSMSESITDSRIGNSNLLSRINKLPPFPNAVKEKEIREKRESLQALHAITTKILDSLKELIFLLEHHEEHLAKEVQYWKKQREETPGLTEENKQLLKTAIDRAGERFHSVPKSKKQTQELIDLLTLILGKSGTIKSC